MKGISYVETKNLDGETNLKPRFVDKTLVNYFENEKDVMKQSFKSLTFASFIKNVSQSIMRDPILTFTLSEEISNYKMERSSLLQITISFSVLAV